MAKKTAEKKPVFEIGDIVALKSGGPDMAVQKVIVTSHDVFDGNYRCQWFAGKKLENGVFPENSLEVTTPKGVTKEA